jgi:hypothetical protein
MQSTDRQTDRQCNSYYTVTILSHKTLFVKIQSVFVSGIRWNERNIRRRNFAVCPATQHTTHNTQHTTHNTHHTTHNTQHTTHNTQHTTHNTHHTSHNTQHTTHNTQHTTHNTQHTTHNTQHTIHFPQLFLKGEHFTKKNYIRPRGCYEGIHNGPGGLAPPMLNLCTTWMRQFISTLWPALSVWMHYLFNIAQ